MRNFKIVFYKSESGELIKVKEFFKEANAVQDLVADPPDEFFEMLESFFPIHGWAEIENTNSTVFVIFAPKSSKLKDIADKEFYDWLDNVQPADFKDSSN